MSLEKEKKKEAAVPPNAGPAIAEQAPSRLKRLWFGSDAVFARSLLFAAASNPYI